MKARDIQNLLFLILASAFVLAAAVAQAAEPLRFIIGTMSYPLEVFDDKGQLTGGLLKDVADEMVRELGTKTEFVYVSRRRVELALLDGDADIACYTSPKWTNNAPGLQWSIPSLPQIERVVGLKGNPMPKKVPEDFSGKRVAVHTGYHFPSIQPLFDNKQATRVDENKVALMFKSLETNHADLLITSEAEISGYFQSNPEARSRYIVSPRAFSIVQTQCAISPKSRWSVEKINKALTNMLSQGDFDRLTRKYGMAMQ